MNEIKLCPQCGSSNTRIQSTYTKDYNITKISFNYYVECLICETKTKNVTYAGRAIVIWNDCETHNIIYKNKKEITKMNEIKSCQSCQSDQVVSIAVGKYSKKIQCSNCGTATCLCNEKGEALKIWNDWNFPYIIIPKKLPEQFHSTYVKPCTNCMGKHIKRTKENNLFYIECESCGTKTKPCPDIYTIKKIWNDNEKHNMIYNNKKETTEMDNENKFYLFDKKEWLDQREHEREDYESFETQKDIEKFLDLHHNSVSIKECTIIYGKKLKTVYTLPVPEKINIIMPEVEELTEEIYCEHLKKTGWCTDCGVESENCPLKIKNKDTKDQCAFYFLSKHCGECELEECADAPKKIIKNECEWLGFDNTCNSEKNTWEYCIKTKPELCPFI